MQKYEIRLNSAYSSALFLSMKAAITRLLSLYRLIHSKTEQSKISFYRIIGPDTCQCFRNITCCFDTFTAFCQAQIGRNTMNVSIKWNNQFTGMKLLPDTKSTQESRRIIQRRNIHIFLASEVLRIAGIPLICPKTDCNLCNGENPSKDS